MARKSMSKRRHSLCKYKPKSKFYTKKGTLRKGPSARKMRRSFRKSHNCRTGKLKKAYKKRSKKTKKTRKSHKKTKKARKSHKRSKKTRKSHKKTKKARKSHKKTRKSHKKTRKARKSHKRTKKTRKSHKKRSLKKRTKCKYPSKFYRKNGTLKKSMKSQRRKWRRSHFCNGKAKKSMKKKTRRYRQRGAGIGATFGRYSRKAADSLQSARKRLYGTKAYKGAKKRVGAFRQDFMSGYAK